MNLSACEFHILRPPVLISSGRVQRFAASPCVWIFPRPFSADSLVSRVFRRRCMRVRKAVCPLAIALADDAMARNGYHGGDLAARVGARLEIPAVSGAQGSDASPTAVSCRDHRQPLQEMCDHELRWRCVELRRRRAASSGAFITESPRPAQRPLNARWRLAILRLQ